MREFLPSKTLLTLYNALFVPHLNYSILLWGNSSDYLLNQLRVLQKRAIRLICNAPFHEHSQPLFFQNKLLTLDDIYNYQLGIFLYKHRHSSLPNDFISFFQTNSNFHSYSTRFKDSLLHPYTRTSLAQSQTRITGVNFWNSLEDPIKRLCTLSMFKKKLKYHLLENYDKG